MGGMAAGISVLGSNVGGAGSVEGFDVEERVGPWPIKAAEHDVWAVLQARTGTRHELLEVAAAARPLGVDVRRAEEGVEAHDPGVDGGVMARARQAHAVPARAEVSVERPDPAQGRVGDVRRAHGADGGATLAVDRREEKQVNGEGDREGGRRLGEGEEGDEAAGGGGLDGHTPPEGEGAAGNAAIQQTGAAGGGGAR